MVARSPELGGLGPAREDETYMPRITPVSLAARERLGPPSRYRQGGRCPFRLASSAERGRLSSG
jgi:hypothetical protein